MIQLFEPIIVEELTDGAVRHRPGDTHKIYRHNTVKVLGS
jgi:hypothetical protein